MAYIDSGTEFGSSPPFIRKVEYTETARTATTVTYTIKLHLKINKSTSASYYAYPMSWSVNGGTSESIKGTEKWYGGQGYRTFTKTGVKITGLGSTKGNASVKVAVTSSSGGNASFTKTYSIPYSTFNTAPKWGSSAVLKVQENNSSGRVLSQTASGTENAVKVAENISNIYLTWPKASDDENNVSKYQLECQVDDGTWSTIYSGSSTSYTHAIGSGSSKQGKKYDYRVKAIDSYNLSTKYLDSTQFQKNTLTGASISSSGSLAYTGTSASPISLTISGAKNTNGNTSFTYKLSSESITIYNATIKGSTKLAIYNSGDTPSTPYVKMSDLKSLFSKSSYKGSFTLKLATTNSYGSTATKTCSISVDLRTNPKAPTITVSGHTTVNGAKYLIPSKGNISLSWSGASDYLGGALSYDVQYALNGSTTYTTLFSNLTTTTCSFKLNTVTKSTSVSFKVVAKTAYSYSASATKSETLHYYSAPSITFSDTSRTIETNTTTVNVKTNTSISGVSITSRSYTGINSTATTFTTNTYTISDTGLTESSTYTISVTVKDNSGLSEGTVTKTLKVSPAIPQLSVREKGIGINCINTGAEEAKLKVNGKTHLAGALNITGETQTNNKPIRFTTADSGNPRIGYETSTRDTYIGNATGSWLRLKPDNTITMAGNKVYAANNKPTASELGVLPLTGGKLTGSLYTGAKQLDTRLTTGNQQIYNVNSTGDKIYFGNPATPVQVEGSALTLNGATTCTSAVRATSFNSGDNGLFASETGYVVLRSKDSSVVYLQGSEVRATKVNDGSTYVPFRAGKITSGNVYLNGGNSLINGSHSLWLEGTNESYTSKKAHIQLNADATSAYVKSSTIYDRTYSASANVHITANGVLGRASSARKYKLDILDVKEEQPDKILDLVPKTWFDKTTTELYANYLTRVVSGEDVDIEAEDIGYLDRQNGLIAEEVIEAGLGEFVCYGKPDENGEREVEGIMYDRLWILLIPLVRQQRDKIVLLEEKINQLEKQK